MGGRVGGCIEDSTNDETCQRTCSRLDNEAHKVGRDRDEIRYNWIGVERQGDRFSRKPTDEEEKRTPRRRHVSGGHCFRSRERTRKSDHHSELFARCSRKKDSLTKDNKPRVRWIPLYSARGPQAKRRTLFAPLSRHLLPNTP